MYKLKREDFSFDQRQEIEFEQDKYADYIKKAYEKRQQYEKQRKIKRLKIWGAITEYYGFALLSFTMTNTILFPLGAAALAQTENTKISEKATNELQMFHSDAPTKISYIQNLPSDEKEPIVYPTYNSDNQVKIYQPFIEKSRNNYYQTVEQYSLQSSSVDSETISMLQSSLQKLKEHRQSINQFNNYLNKIGKLEKQYTVKKEHLDQVDQRKEPYIEVTWNLETPNYITFDKFIVNYLLPFYGLGNLANLQLALAFGSLTNKWKKRKGLNTFQEEIAQLKLLYHPDDSYIIFEEKAHECEVKLRKICNTRCKEKNGR